VANRGQRIDLCRAKCGYVTRRDRYSEQEQPVDRKRRRVGRFDAVEKPGEQPREGQGAPKEAALAA
jgi:hypothetical protein